MIPLEGVGDYVDIGSVVNWPQASVVVVFILAVIVWPGFAGWLNSRKAKESAQRTETSLTTNNGGSTTKDQLDRIEKTLQAHVEWSGGWTAAMDERVTKLEAKPARRRLFSRR
jgi:Tfp pilus assembly protein FimT